MFKCGFDHGGYWKLSLVAMVTATAPVDDTHNAPKAPGGIARIIRPRRTWPGSRATVGGLLIAMAAIGLFAAFQRADSPPDTLYLVARDPIAPGTVLTAEILGAQRIDLPSGIAARSFTIAEEATILGAVTTQAIGTGELIQLSDVRIGSGQTSLAPFEMSFRIDADRAVNGGLMAGERVNVIATIGSGSDAPTQLVLTDIVLLDVTRQGDSGLAADRQVITVALHDEAHILAIAAAADKGTLTLVRSNS